MNPENYNNFFGTVYPRNTESDKAYTTIKTSDFQVKDSGERQNFETGMVRDTDNNKGNPHLLPNNAIKRLCVLLQKGKEKYGANNWRKMGPASRFYDSAYRHMTAWAEGDRSEDHAAAVLFNFGAIMELEHGISTGLYNPDLMDMPYIHENPYAPKDKP